MSIGYIITIGLVALVAYSIGVLVGLRFAQTITQAINQSEQSSSQSQASEAIQTSSYTQPPRIYTYSVDPSGEIHNSTQVPYDNEEIRSAITAAMGRFVTNGIAEQLATTQDPQAVFGNDIEKLSKYVYSPYVSIDQLKYLLELLDRAELFRWSQLTLQRIKQLENE